MPAQVVAVLRFKAHSAYAVATPLDLRPLHENYKNCLRTAELARLLASVLRSRGMCEMEKHNERANLRQIQFREYRRGLWQLYSPLICLTTTSESE